MKTQKELWTGAGSYQQAVLWYLRQLREHGVIESHRAGRTVRYRLTGRLELVKDRCAAMWEGFRSDLLKRLAADGVAPRVLRDDAKGVIIQLDLGQRKFSLKVERI